MTLEKTFVRSSKMSSSQQKLFCKLNFYFGPRYPANTGTHKPHACVSRHLFSDLGVAQKERMSSRAASHQRQTRLLQPSTSPRRQNADELCKNTQWGCQHDAASVSLRFPGAVNNRDISPYQQRQPSKWTAIRWRCWLQAWWRHWNLWKYFLLPPVLELNMLLFQMFLVM